MATSVKLDEETKSRLEELQAEIKLETGRKVTQQELLGRLIDDAYASKAGLIDSFRDEGPEMTEEEIDAFLSGTSSRGEPIDESDIDDVLYVDEQLE